MGLKMGKKILIAIVIILVIAGIGVGVYFLLNNNKEETKTI